MVGKVAVPEQQPLPSQLRLIFISQIGDYPDITYTEVEGLRSLSRRHKGLSWTDSKSPRASVFPRYSD